MIYILQQPLLFVKSIFHYVIAVFVVGTFFVFRNSVEKLCDEWVLSTSVCGTGVFSAHTATHSISGNAHETQNFSTKLRKTKKVPTTNTAIT